MKAALNKVLPLKVVEINEIPDIELYMDQVTTFMENKLSSYKRNEEDKILTKTMINNYAKEKLFPAPIKKKYNKNHIILLIIIYHLKSILSISDIKTLLLPVNEELKSNPNSIILEEIYSKFLKIQKNVSLSYLEEGKNSCSLDFSGDAFEKILNVLLLTCHAEIEKKIAENLIDER